MQRPIRREYDAVTDLKDRQVQRVLNLPVPRPGEAVVIRTGISGEDDVELHGHMPGGLEYDQALVKVDFQMWPLFKALDIDSILTCVEVSSAQWTI